MQAARSRLLLGDQSAAQDLIPLLLSEDEYTRAQAIDALEAQFGDRRGYDPAAEESARRAAAARWSE
jgi:HEAT repeat protein